MGVASKLIDLFTRSAADEAGDGPDTDAESLDWIELETTPERDEETSEERTTERKTASEEHEGTITADGGTVPQSSQKTDQEAATATPPEPDKPEIEAVIEEDPQQLYDSSGTAMRAIDEEFNVVKQNSVMADWTGIDGNNRDIKCMNQLSGAVCGTENCTVIQLMEQGEQRIEVEIEKELPNGETKDTLLVSERLTNDEGEVVGITESFKDITHLKNAQQDVNDSVSELTEASEGVAESSEEISKTADEMSTSMEQVTSEVANVSATVEEVASSAEQVSAVSSRAKERAQEGYETAEGAIDSMEDIDTAADDVADDVADLRTRVDDIDEIVELINDIADQTNLLALNANIEAARAGEEGEGFAVVANEVKNLAEESQKHASTIESMIDGIKDDTEDTVESLEDTTAEIDEGIDMVEETMQNLEAVVDSIQEAANGIEEVADAADDQAASTEEVAAMVDEANAKAEEVSAEVQNIAAANEEQAQMISDIEGAVERLNQGM